MTELRKTQDSSASESWVFHACALASDTYLIKIGGEVSLMNEDTLKCLLKQLTEEYRHD